MTTAQVYRKGVVTIVEVSILHGRSDNSQSGVHVTCCKEIFSSG